MEPTKATIDCPDCAQPIPLDTFANWGAQTMFKTTACAGCGSTVTFPSDSAGVLDTSRASLGRGVHGATREEREMEGLASRPRLEQPD